RRRGDGSRSESGGPVRSSRGARRALPLDRDHRPVVLSRSVALRQEELIHSRQQSGGFMTRCRSVVIAAAGVALLAAATPGFAQSKAKAQNVPEIPYDSVPNFFKLPPNVYFGEGIGIATNSKGHVFVYTRSGETRLFEFDQNGVFVREIGQGLYGLLFAHA